MKLAIFDIDGTIFRSSLVIELVRALVKEKMPRFAWLVEYNPLAYIIETSRYMLLNIGHVSVQGISYTILFTLVVFFVGLLVFNKTEKSFIDTV